MGSSFRALILLVTAVLGPLLSAKIAHGEEISEELAIRYLDAEIFLFEGREQVMNLGARMVNSGLIMGEQVVPFPEADTNNFNMFYLRMPTGMKTYQFAGHCAEFSAERPDICQRMDVSLTNKKSGALVMNCSFDISFRDNMYWMEQTYRCTPDYFPVNITNENE